MLNKALALLLVAALMLACGCSGGAGATPEPTATPEVLLEATPSPAPVKGGTLRLPMPANADKTDPLLVNTEEMLMLYSLVFESLISLDESGRPVPGIAENWSCDESGRVWTLKLRSGALWHDTGIPVSAADVVQTYERIVSLAGASYYAYATRRIESITQGDGGTVKVTMKQPGIASLCALTFPVTQSTLNATGNYPAGTGPYKFAFVSQESVRLERNGKWWKQAPNIETVEFYARESNDISLASYAAGQLDMVFTSSLTVGRYREEGHTTVADMMTQNVEAMTINFSNPNLRSIKVRQAIACAINRSRIITNVYMNRARACDVPIAPDSWFYESKSALYDYNPEVALSLFAEDGWTDGDGDGFLEKDGEELTLRLLVNESTDTVRKTAAEQIAAQLTETGIHMEIVSAGFTLGDEASEYLVKLRSGDFDLALVGFNVGRDGDLTAFLSTSGARNYGKYSNAAVEQLASNMLGAKTESEYIEAASKLQIAFAEELPFITLYFRLNSVIYNDDIMGVAGIREPDVLRSIASWYIADVE